MLTEFWTRIDKHSENFNKELKKYIKNESELKNTVSKMENRVDGINSRVGDTEQHTNDLKFRIMEITQSE